MKKFSSHYFFTLLFIFFCYPSYSQNKAKVDSLLTLLKTAKEDKNKVNQLNNLGEELMYSNPDTSIIIGNQALLLAKKVEWKVGIANSFGKLGAYNAIKGDYPRALDYYLKTLKVEEELKNKKEIATQLDKIGVVYMTQGDYSKASGYYFSALKIDEELKNKKEIATTLGNIGSLYTTIGKYKEAEQYLKRAIILDDSIGVMDELRQFEELISQLYDTTGRYKLALIHYKKAMVLKDTLFSEENKKQLVHKEMNYEFEKKEATSKAEHEKELAVAAAATRETITQRNMWIGGSFALVVLGTLLFFYIRTKRINEKISLEKEVIELEQKALRLQMNPHFIFNALNSIQGFITENDPNSAKKYLTKFARLMRLILENSFEPAVSLQNEIEVLNNYLELTSLRFSNKFNFVIDVDGQINTSAVEIPPMLLQPFVENAILHGIASKESNGNINIGFRKKDNSIECTIEGNGIGRQKAMEQKSTSHKSTGMLVTEERLKIYSDNNNTKAKLNVVDLMDKLGNACGTKVIIDIPFQLSWS